MEQQPVGGIVRDVFAMGRTIALPTSLRRPQGSTSTLPIGEVAGIADYGNTLQVPTVGGEVYFHPSYQSNCLAMCVGLVDHALLPRA